MPNNQTCGNCKHWVREKVEPKYFGVCEYPVPRWMMGYARITHMTDENCSTWSPSDSYIQASGSIPPEKV